MKNFVKDGKVMDYANAGSAIAAGSVVVLSGIGVGVAAVDIAATTGVGSLVIEGVFELAKATGGAISQGARLYWDAGNSRVTTTVGSNQFMGFAFKAAGINDTKVQVKLVPCGDSDPGNLAQAAAVADLNQDISNTYVEAEVQAISDKVDELLASLRAASLLASS